MTRAAELLGALSLATDEANGVGPETAMRTAVVAVRLAHAVGAPVDVRRGAYWLALFRFLGCTAYAHETAAKLGGDDRAVLAALMHADTARPASVARALGTASAGAPWTTRAAALGRAALDPGLARALTSAHCALASTLAEALGAPAAVVAALGELYERWDGRGTPMGRAGEALAPASRLVHVAARAESARMAGGPESVPAAVAARAGRELDPALAAALVAEAPALLSGLEGSVFELYCALEPGEPWVLSDEGLERVAVAFAHYADLKSPYTVGHSPAVGRTAEAAGRALGLDHVRLRRAGYLHDLGRVAVPNAIWDKRGPLGRVERDRMRAHSYHTERILAFTPLLAPLAALAGAAHDRLDGSGYHHGGASTSPEARVLAVADVWCALGEARPHRPALGRDDAARLLRHEAQRGALEARAVEVVLDTTGGAEGRPRAPWPDALSAREVEVLRGLARGLSNKEIASLLGISPKTAQHHVAHVYEKTGVRSRAAAALYAVRHGLTEA